MSIRKIKLIVTLTIVFGFWIANVHPAQASWLSNITGFFNKIVQPVQNIRVDLNKIFADEEEQTSAPNSATNDLTIAKTFNGKSLQVTACGRFSGAICSVTLDGQELLNRSDNGRLLQSATAFFSGECYNPTEGGGSASSSKLLASSITDNTIQTKTQMAFWYSRNANVGYCSNYSFTPDYSLSNHYIEKKVSIGYRDIENVVVYDGKIIVPDESITNGKTMNLEGTGYMENMGEMYSYDPKTKTLTLLNGTKPTVVDGNGFPLWQFNVPVIIASSDKNYAMGVFIAGKNPEYRVYDLFPGLTKWSFNRQEYNVKPGEYAHTFYVPVGALSEVTVALDKLYSYLGGTIIPTSTPTSTPTPIPTPTPTLTSTPTPTPTLTPIPTPTPAPTQSPCPWWDLFCEEPTPIPTPTPASPGTLLGMIPVSGTNQYIRDPSGPACSNEQVVGGFAINYSGPITGSSKVNQCNPNPFYFVQLPAGTYTVSVTAPSGWEVVGQNQQQVIIQSGQNKHQWWAVRRTNVLPPTTTTIPTTTQIPTTTTIPPPATKPFARHVTALAFKPRTTDIANLFDQSIRGIAADLTGENYYNIAAIDSCSQSERLTQARQAQDKGFNAIELDEQLTRNCITVAQFSELKNAVSLPIAITDHGDKLASLYQNGAWPDAVYVELYDSDWRSQLAVAKSAIPNTIPIYTVVNIAEFYSSDHVREIGEYAWQNSDGVWFWGWGTGVDAFVLKSQANWPMVKSLVRWMKLGEPLPLIPTTTTFTPTTTTTITPTPAPTQPPCPWWDLFCEEPTPIPTPTPASPGTLLGMIPVSGTSQYIRDPSGPTCSNEQVVGGFAINYSGPITGSSKVNQCNPNPFYFVQLPAGTYTVSVAAPLGWEVVGQNQQQVTIQSGQNKHQWWAVRRTNVLPPTTTPTLTPAPIITPTPTATLTPTPTPISIPTTTTLPSNLTYYVSPSGSDRNSGTSESVPFRTIERARDVVRAINNNMSQDITVYLRGGTYELGQTLVLNQSDSGTNGRNIIYKNYASEKPVISGGRTITGWAQEGDKWKANVGTALQTRQLYVNGARAVRARSVGGLPGGAVTAAGYTTSDSDMRSWGNIRDVEFVQNNEWKQFRCGVQSVSGAAIVMKQPCWDNARSHQNGPKMGLPTWIENAFELLDQPGEWYLNRANGYLYYKPLSGETTANTQVIMPVLETLVSGNGTLDNPIKNIRFEGITFSYAGWTAPNNNDGFSDIQASFHNIGPGGISGSPWEKVPANIVFKTAKAVQFERNTFTHLGGAGLSFEYGSKDNIISGNVFTDISSTGIDLGDIDKPKTTDDREITRNNQITNNYIHDIAVEYRGGVGIWIGYAQNSMVAHNELFDLPYTAISIGWGWGGEDPSIARNNKVQNNLIYDHVNTLFDGGGIYSLSAQPGNIYSGNVIKNQTNDYGAIYLDNRSRGIVVDGNVLFGNKRSALFKGGAQGGEHVIINNYWQNRYQNDVWYFYSAGEGAYAGGEPGPNRIENNHEITDISQVPASILNNAGLETSYANIKNTLTGPLLTPQPNIAITVSIRAKGTPALGQYPIIQLRQGDSTLQSWDVTGEYQDYTYSTTSAVINLAADKLRVYFINDYFNPYTKQDRNLIVDYIRVNNQIYQSESQQTFASGRWTPSTGCASGYLQTETLHCNGYFEYNITQPVSDSDGYFGANLWEPFKNWLLK